MLFYNITVKKWNFKILYTDSVIVTNNPIHFKITNSRKYSILKQQHFILQQISQLHNTYGSENRLLFPIYTILLSIRDSEKSIRFFIESFAINWTKRSTADAVMHGNRNLSRLFDI